jgi:glucose/arabinose dehydrogenase
LVEPQDWIISHLFEEQAQGSFSVMNRRTCSSLLALMIGTLPAISAELPQTKLEVVTEGLTSPMALVELPDGARIAVDQVGFIRALGTDGKLAEEPVADFTDRMITINRNYDERGLLDLVLHPKFKSNRKVFVYYSAPKDSAVPSDWDSSSVVAEYTLKKGSPLKLDMASEKVLLRFGHPFGNHNGGRMAFGPDGFLYIGSGDGGAANDQGRRPPEGNGQNLQTLLGKILRIDVDNGQPYGVPTDNPFADGKSGRAEIFAYGFRNPWGVSFDRGGNHELFVADVGQNLFEEVDIVVKGGNYGWNLREGFQPFDPKSAKPGSETGASKGSRGEPLLDPIVDYPHRTQPATAVQGISITGGYVYRGKAIPSLVGHYVFADWARNQGVGDGRLLVATRPTSGSKWGLAELPVDRDSSKPGPYITALSESRDGELYVLIHDRGNPTGTGGKVMKLVPAK